MRKPAVKKKQTPEAVPQDVDENAQGQSLQFTTKLTVVLRLIEIEGVRPAVGLHSCKQNNCAGRVANLQHMMSWSEMKCLPTDSLTWWEQQNLIKTKQKKINNN